MQNCIPFQGSRLQPNINEQVCAVVGEKEVEKHFAFRFHVLVISSIFTSFLIILLPSFGWFTWPLFLFIN
jgi:hypothetical protein